MKTLLNQYDTDQQTTTIAGGAQVSSTSMSVSKLEEVLCYYKTLLDIFDQAEQRRDRGDGDER